MPAAISRTDIERIAALAHLELREDEVELFTAQLGDVLDYANQLQRIDTTGVPPTSSVLIQRGEAPGIVQGVGAPGTVDFACERADEVAPNLDRDIALANAPDPVLEAGLFRVPRVIG